MVLLILTLLSSGRTDTLPPGAEEAGGFYELRQWETSVDGNRVKIKVRERFTILSARGDNLGYVSFLMDRFSRFDKLKIDVFDAEGKKLFTRKAKDLNRACGFGASFVLYNDVCQRYGRIFGPAYPYTVEISYTEESKSLFFWPSAAFQSEVPVLKARYELEIPKNLGFAYRMYGMDIDPVIESDGDKLHYTWSANDVAPQPGATDGYLIPQDAHPARLVFAPERFSLGEYTCEGGDWDAIAEWYRSMAQDKYLDIPQNVVPVPDEDWLALVQKAYERVIGTCHYIAVSIGVGGWQPHAASFTEQHGYGDCKDMSTLLVSYLRQDGIQAYPVLVMTRGSGWTDPSFVSARFNHVIAVAINNGDTVWMDPTCEDCPFGVTPAGDEDILVLLVGDDRGHLIATPATTPEDNCLVRSTRIHLSSDVQPTFSSTWSASGNAALTLLRGLEHADHEQRMQFAADQFSRAARKWTVTDCQLTQDPSQPGTVGVQIEGKSPRSLTLIGQDYALNPFCFSAQCSADQVQLATREVALDLGYPSEIIDTVLVSWNRVLVPNVLSSPEGGEAYCSAFSCKTDYVVSADSLLAVATTRRLAYTLPVEDYAEYGSYSSEHKRLVGAYCTFSRSK